MVLMASKTACSFGARHLPRMAEKSSCFRLSRLGFRSRV